MSNLHRIQWIDHQIREKRFPNCSTIAEEFCISVRQASRDIEYLKDSLSAPVGYSARHRGYFYSEEAFILPALFLAKEERQALSFLADRYKSGGSEMTDRLAALFERLSGTDATVEPGSPDIPVYRVSNKILSAIESVKKAIAEKRKIVIDYTDSAPRTTTRTVRPYIIHGKKRARYLHAFCEMRQDERDFRIDRIASVTVTATPFTLPDNFDPADYDQDIIFDFREPYHAEVRFDGDKSLPKQTTGENTPSTVKNIKFQSSEELFKQLLGKGGAFTIIGPEWLKNKFSEYIRNILEKNR